MENETYNGWTHEEILETISEAINEVDHGEKYSLGDRLFDVIIALKYEWGMNLE